MKSKQRLAKVVALALVLGFGGTYGVMADDIQMRGDSKTIENQTVKGAWLDEKSMLTANNVTFVDDPTNHDEDPTTPDGLGEVAVDGGSTLTMNGGAIKVSNDYFTAKGGSVVNIYGAEVTSGAYANNANITLENSKISGRALYAGNDWEKDTPLPLGKAEGQPGKVQVNGGTVNVALIWGQASWKDGATNAGGVYFGKDAEVTVRGTEGLKLPDGKVLTGIYATEHGIVKFDGAKKADISEIHAEDNSDVEFSKVADVKTGDVYIDNHGTVNFTHAADVKTGDVYISNAAIEIWNCPDVTLGNMYVSKGGYLDAETYQDNEGTSPEITSKMNIGDIHVVGDETRENASSQLPISTTGEGSSVFFYGKTQANIKNIDMINGGHMDLEDDADVKVDHISSDYSYLSVTNDKDDNKLPNLTVGDLNLNNGSEIAHVVWDDSKVTVEREAAGDFTLGRLNVNNSKINFGKDASVTFDNQLATNSGLYVSNGGVVNFNGTSEVAADTVKADAGTVSLKDSKGTFKNVALTQGASLTADSGAVVTADTLNVQGGARAIAGNDGKLDVADAMNITNGGIASVAEGGTLNAKSVQVSGNKSTFVQQGKSNAAVSSLAINQGGTASITGGAEAKVDNLTIQNASLDLGNGTNKLTVAKSLVSNKGLVRTANADNQVVLAADATKTGDVTVQGEGKDYNSDALAGDSSKVKSLAKVVTTADGKTAASTVSGSEGVINGASVYKVENTADGDIKITESYIPENETNRAITDLAALSLITWRQENNDLNKRLGEIRDSKGDDGVWARMARGEATFKGVKNQYNYYQMGYDKKLNDNWILGGAFSYTDGDNTFHSGTGQTKNSSFAVYGSNLRDDGSFIDLIAKYAHLKNEYDTPLGIGSGDYSTNGFSFSGEYGKRFHMDKFWLEPQVELTWGHVDSVNYSTENGARVHQNGMDSFVGRLGFSLGKDFSRGNVYARASYLYDFDGDVKASMTNGTVSREYREDIGGGWFEFGVGTNLNLGRDTHFYFDLERAEGGSGNVKTPWQWNVGVRYSF